MEILSDATFKGNLSVEGNLELEAGGGNKLTFVKLVCGIELCYSNGGNTIGQFELNNNSTAHGLSLHISSFNASPTNSPSDYRIKISDGNGEHGGNSHVVMYNNLDNCLVANLAFPKNGSSLQELATTNYVENTVCSYLQTQSKTLRFRNPEIPANCTKFAFVDPNGSQAKIKTSGNGGWTSEFFITQVYDMDNHSTVQMDTCLKIDLSDESFNLLGTVSNHTDIIPAKKYIAVVSR